MPLKEETEVQLLRSLSNTPLQVEITFLTTATYIGTNTPASHLNEFYKTIEDVKDRKFDGLIITGAPIEHMEYEDVQYWDELTKIMDWSNTNVTSTLPSLASAVNVALAVTCFPSISSGCFVSLS